MRPLYAIVATALVLIGCVPLLGDSCAAEAEAKATKQLEKNLYLISFRVTSDGCSEYSCRGHVKFKVNYSYKDSAGLAHHGGSNELVGYFIQKPNKSTEVSTKVTITGGFVLDGELDDVEVDSVSCTIH